MKTNLLLVDDEAAIRGLTAMELQLNGFAVTAVATGEEALSLLDQRSFNVLITDLRLSDGDGLNLLESTKKWHPQLPVIILTGMGFDDEIMREALEKGADGYVSKGLTMSHLRMEIDRVLKKADSASYPRPMSTAD